MGRYRIKERILDKGWVIWDQTLARFVGDGKGGMHHSPTYDNALDVVSILVKRVAA